MMQYDPAITLPLMALGGILLLSLIWDHGGDDGGGKKHDPDPHEVNGTSGDDQITAEDGFTGTIHGQGGDDRITVNSGDNPALDHIRTGVGDVEWHNSTQPGSEYPGSSKHFPHGLTVVDGGSGNDTISVQSGAAHILDSKGADLVDLRQAHNAVAYGGKGDTIVGSNQSGANIDAFIEGRGEFQGGTASEHATALGDGAKIHGGKGNDTLMSDDGAAHLIGGAGNDVLYGSVKDDAFNPKNAGKFGNYMDDARDTLEGGQGNDVIHFSNKDIVSGGDGDDRFYAEVNPGDAAQLSDFTPGKENVWVSIQDKSKTVQEFSSRIGLAEVNGDSVLYVDGKATVNLAKTSGLTVGFTRDDGDSFYDTAGKRVEWSDLDIIVSNKATPTKIA